MPRRHERHLLLARGLLHELPRLARQERVEAESDRLVEILRRRPGDHADGADGVGTEREDERLAAEQVGHLLPEIVVRQGRGVVARVRYEGVD